MLLGVMGDVVRWHERCCKGASVMLLEGMRDVIRVMTDVARGMRDVSRGA